MNEPMRLAAGGSYRTMHSQLASIIRREPVTVAPGTSVHSALQIMEQHHIGSIVITDPQTGIPLGIFTTQDLLRLIASHGQALDQPIDEVMTRGLVTLEPQATAYDAALLMAQKKIRHLLVVDDSERLLGVVSQNDLFALQRVSISQISDDISTAEDVERLARCANDIRLLANNMLAQGIGAEQLTHFISTLNDLLTRRLLELTLREFDLSDIQWCWIALGSEGRFEQTFTSDQDNGIIFDAPDDLAEETRNRLLPFAQSVNRKLDSCGFLLCKGNIMAGNPMWCLSQKEWQKKFAGWIDAAVPQSILNASIFFDFRALFGAGALATDLKAWLFDTCQRTPLFLHHMARNALQRRPPLGFVKEFRFEKSTEFPRTIDLKMYGAWFFVDAGRILSLAAGIAETSTAQRLRKALDGNRQDAGNNAAAIVDAFYFIQSLRLLHQHTLRGKPGGANRINPYDLNAFERQMLKEAFRQAGKLQRKLKLDYQI